MEREMIDLFTNEELPPECRDCLKDCYDCDMLEQKVAYTEREQLVMERKLAEQAIRRYEKRIVEIDRKLFLLDLGKETD